MQSSTISETFVPTESKLGYEIAVSEMKYRLEEQYKSISAFKSITQQIFAAASLIVALGSSLQLFNVRVAATYQTFYNCIILIAMGSYALLISFCIVVLFPIKVKGPTSAERDLLFQRFIWRTNDLEIIRQQLDNYLAAISSNEPIIQKRRKLAMGSAILLPLIVILFLILSLIPRTPIN